MIRIISGTHRGRRISAPKKLPVRPTTDRAKEALFSILNHRIAWDDVRVLDLYAGTGNLSYECASRGCPDVTAVDAHPGCAAFIRQTAAALNLPIRAFRQDAITYLQMDRSSYELVLADPPYDLPEEDLRALARLCLDEQRLRPEGIFVLEHRREYDFSDLPGYHEKRVYGGTAFSLFVKE